MTISKKLSITLLTILIAGMFIPQQLVMPVKGGQKSDYNQESFWYYPWGRSVTHKGVDIFAKKGTDLNASVSGVVLYTGFDKIGGNVIIILGPKWRLHYFAHLNEINTSFGWTNRNDKIGTVGDSGNAKGKPPHLHYSIITLFPYFWNIDFAPQGWKKMFYLDPISYLNEALG